MNDVLNTTPNEQKFIQEVLGGFYQIEAIHTCSFQYDEGSDEFQIKFDFKPYRKVIRPLDHISGNQIHEAIMEACYLIAGFLVKKGDVEDISLDDFLNFRATAIFREIQIKFKKEIITGETHALRFKVLENKNLRGKFSTFSVGFRGFAEGSSKALIRTNDLVDKILEK